MTLKYILPVGAFVIALAAMFIAQSKSPAPVPVITETPSTNPSEQLGGIPGNEIQGNEFVLGGAHFFAYNSGLLNASTTCQFRLPAATSTEISAAVKFTNVFGGSFDVEFGRSLNVMATTTRISYKTGVNSQASIIASTTVNAELDGSGTFPPNSYLAVKIGSTTPTVKGSCSALFMVI